MSIYLKIKQRARRFVGGQDKEQILQYFKESKEEMEHKLKLSLDLKPNTSWDHNVITPGTSFMKKVADALLSYSIKRCKESDLWKNFKVIISDASVPGEGEHKIYEFIRAQQSSPKYKDLTHVIHGLDADLLMLSLLTHEKNFYVLREQQTYWMNPVKSSNSNLHFKPLIIVEMENLRRNLEEFFDDMKGYLGDQYDLLRVIDDFVFLCFFVGNDFLPNFPALDIEEGAIDMLIDLYKVSVAAKRTYITNGREISLERIFDLLELISNVEEMIFFSRYLVKVGHGNPNAKRTVPKKQFTKEYEYVLKNGTVDTFVAKMAQDKAYINKLRQDGIPSHINKEDPKWRDAYYLWKLDVKKEKLDETKKELSKSYIKGLVFVWKYYTAGIPAWGYYYPFHYAPFSQDCLLYKDEILKEMKNYDFPKGEPFKPFDQLMSVLPKYSAHCLPKVYSEMMCDPKSKISYFYPDKFDRDLNGKSKEWKSVVLLPFINETELLNITKELENELTPEEKERNSLGTSFIVIHKDHKEYKLFKKVDHSKDELSLLLNAKIFLNLYKPKKIPIPEEDLDNDVCVLAFSYPKVDEKKKESIQEDEEEEETQREEKQKNTKKNKGKKVTQLIQENDFEEEQVVYQAKSEKKLPRNLEKKQKKKIIDEDKEVDQKTKGQQKRKRDEQETKKKKVKK